MKGTLTIAAAVLFLTTAAGAQTITGIVVNADDHAPLANATITIEGSQMKLASDNHGRFAMASEGAEKVKVSVSYVGFASVNDVELLPGRENRIELMPRMSVLDNVVVTANRYEKDAYKVSQPITATGAREIESKGYNMVSDVIRAFPGVDMNDAGPFRARPVIRGLYGTRILVLVDGEKLNDQRDISSFAGVGMSLVDVNSIDRIEVVNGPSSVLYGSDAMGGVVNIITKKNAFNGRLVPFVKYSGNYSTADEQHSNRFDLGFESSRLSASAGFLYREALKDYQPPAGWNDRQKYHVFRTAFYDSLNRATGRDFSGSRLVNSRARVNNYDFSLAYKMKEHHRLDLTAGAFRGNDIGYPGVPNDSTPYWFFYPSHDRDNIAVTYTGENISRRLARLQARAFYEKLSKDFLTDFLGGMVIPAGPGMTISPLTSLSHTVVRKYGLNFQELYNFGKQSQVTFGIDYLREDIDGDVTSVTKYVGFGPSPFNETTVGSSVPRNDWNELGVYGSGEVEIGRLRTTLGARFDEFWINTDRTPGYVDDDDNPLPTEDERYSAVNGSLGLAYAVGKGVNLVANVGTAYRVPNVVERFYDGSASGRETRPSPDIKPERSVSVDYGFKGVHNRISYSVMGFRSDYTDFTQLEKFDSTAGHGGQWTPLWRYENIDDVTIWGFEGVIEGHLPGGPYGSLSVAYQHGQNNTFKQPLYVSPMKTVVTMGYRHKRHGLFGEFSVRRCEKQTRIPNVTYLDDIATDGFTVVNATAGVRLFKQVRLSVSGRNLFDEVYAEPFNARNPDNPIVEPGRNFVFTLSTSI
jgi:outer membrane receptor protein involved in Fe transport